MCGHFDLTKSAFSEWFLEYVVANFGIGFMLIIDIVLYGSLQTSIFTSVLIACVLTSSSRLIGRIWIIILRATHNRPVITIFIWWTPENFRRTFDTLIVVTFLYYFATEFCVCILSNLLIHAFEVFTIVVSFTCVKCRWRRPNNVPTPRFLLLLSNVWFVQSV